VAGPERTNVSGTFQIGGLISGLDTNKIIDQLMTVEKQPLTDLQNREQAIKDRKAAFSDLNDKLNDLRSKTLNILLSTTTQARLGSSSNTGVATASASPNTPLQNINLTVSQLATKTSVTSTGAIGQPIDPTVALVSAGLGITPTSGSFSINGKSITVNAGTDSLNTVIANINASGAGVTASLTGNGVQLTSNSGDVIVGTQGDTSNFLAATHLDAAPTGGDLVTTWTKTSTVGIGVAQTTTPLASARLATGLSSATGSFTINGVTFNWNSATDTISGLISQINSSGAKVTASYDQATDTVTLLSNTTGQASIALQDVSGNLLDALGLASASQTLGQNAAFSVNGGPTQYSTSNVISNAVQGVTFSLKGTGATTIGVEQDVQTAVSAVKDFVTAYNAALDLVRKDTAVDPSTSQGAIFTGDSFVQGVETALRNLTSTSATGLTTQYTDLPTIGLSSGAIGSLPGSTNALVLDEGKLTQALQTDPTAVTSLLQATGGPLSTLNSYLLNATSYSGPINTSQLSADSQIRDLESRMQTLQERLDQKQQALQAKFARLEEAMAKLQAQSSQLTGQLGSLGALAGAASGGSASA
jgi:flagellar hook-associated protein 2